MSELNSLVAGTAQQISLGPPVAPTDANALYTDEDTRITQDFYSIHRYEEDGGLYSTGITSAQGFAGNKAAIFQLAAPRTLLIIDWTIEMAVDNQDYTLWPDWEPSSTNYILADRHLEPTSMDMKADGESPVYRISGTYVYLVLNGDQVQWRHGRPPWMSTLVRRQVDPNLRSREMLWG